MGAAGPSRGSGELAPTADAAAQGIVLQRRIEALSRLRPPASLRARVGRLVDILMRLRQLYLAGSQSSGAQRDAIAATEQQATAYAMEAGLPQCSLPMGGIPDLSSPREGVNRRRLTNWVKSADLARILQ